MIGERARPGGRYDKIRADFFAGWPVVGKLVEHAHVGVRAGSKAAQVLRGDAWEAQNVRRQNDQHFVVGHVLFGFREQIFEAWNARGSRYSVEVIGRRVLNQAAEDVYFAVLQPDFVFDLALVNDRLGDTADGLEGLYGGNFPLQYHVHAPFGMDTRLRF